MLTADGWRRVERLLQEAMQVSSGERAAFVASIGDADVRAEVESLLAAEGGADDAFVGAVIGEAARAVLDESLTGRMLGHFQVIKPIGHGSMGEVYLAQDVKLGRQVALKLLPSAFQHDPERVRRFEREARTVAALNHPNIMTVHEVGEWAGRLFIAAEYVEGETVADRLLRGPFAAPRAIQVAAQIAGALAAVHEKGIVHRDLKPANIIIKADGAVKVLDFGLATLAEELPPAASARNPPAETQPPTRPGVILGTAAYMSPEQARGTRVDKRADIWAFGVVLYEMLTGKRAFERDTTADTLAALVKEEPDLTRLPARLRIVAGRCLRKDLRERWQDIGDVRLALEGDLLGLDIAEPLAPVGSRAPWIVAAAACIAALVVSIWPLRQSGEPVQQPLIRLNVDLGPEASIEGGRGMHVTAISPDGMWIAFACQALDGEPRICARRLDQTRASALPGTEGVQLIFFSPDGRWIGFGAHEKLKKVSVGGGAPITLCDAPFVRGAAWSEDGFIIASLDAPEGLSRIPENGGIPRPLTELKPGEQRHRWPQAVPGRNAVLFTASTEPGQYENASLDLVSLKTGERITLHRGGYYGRYLPSGHLIYMHQGTLFGARMDFDRLVLTSAPTPLLEDVASRPGDGGADFEFSQSGIVVYQSRGSGGGQSTVQWLRNSGEIEPLLPNPAGYDWIRLSPDGKRLALIDNGVNRDIWVYDLERRTMTRITFGGVNDTVVWSPDGKHLAYAVSGQKAGVWWARADGSGEPQWLSETFWHLYSFSPDGKRLAVSSGADIWTIPLEGPDPDHPKMGAAEPFLSTPVSELSPAFSPDGRWLAYTSDESGPSQIYVRSTLGEGGKWQVSKEGGTNPVWSRNGRELFFLSAGRRIMVTSYRVKDDTFLADNPVTWSDLQMIPSSSSLVFLSTVDLAPDGNRFAVLVPSSAKSHRPPTHVNVLFNFFDELRRKTAGGEQE